MIELNYTELNVFRVFNRMTNKAIKQSSESSVKKQRFEAGFIVQFP